MLIGYFKIKKNTFGLKNDISFKNVYCIISFDHIQENVPKQTFPNLNKMI